MSAKTPHFLVIDDFGPMRKLIVGNLQQAGFVKITQAGDGYEAKMFLESNSVDFIISDWNMPRLNGLELLDYIRTDARHKKTHFMLVTAENDRDMVRDAIQKGVDEFLIKPFTFAAFDEKLQTMLKRPARAASQRPIPSMNSLETISAPSKTAATLTHKKIIRDKASILVVDDIPANIDVIVGTLKEDYQVKAVKQGAAAIKICQDDLVRPDLILLDIMMPEMDGYQVCEQLKADPATSHIPIIFLSAKGETDDMTRGFELGAEDYVVKPANPLVLKARVKAHLRLKEIRDDLEDQVDALMENTRLREDVERITRHDIKGPLATVIGLTETLAADLALDGVHTEKIDQIHDASLKMLGMINRSLDLYKMETGSYDFNPQRFNLSALLKKIVESLELQAQQQQVTIAFNPAMPYTVLAEELLCYSMFGNLLKNALEASPAGQMVTVSIANPNAHSVMVTLENVGSVPSAIRDTFFEKYITAGKDGGTGLGTYSAYLIAKTQGGDITLDSSKPNSTTITVTLKAAK